MVHLNNEAPPAQCRRFVDIPYKHFLFLICSQSVNYIIYILSYAAVSIAAEACSCTRRRGISVDHCAEKRLDVNLEEEEGA